MPGPAAAFRSGPIIEPPKSSCARPLVEEQSGLQGAIKKMRILGIVALSAALTGCVTNNETVQFRTSNPQQQAMMRDGQPALVSRPGISAGACFSSPAWERSAAA